MNRLTLAFVAIAATVSGIAASLFTVLLLGAAQPEPVQAAPDKPEATTPIRIAVVNLEEVSRSSPEFQKRKERWEDAQREIRTQAADLKARYERAVEEYEHARGGDGIEVLMLGIEVKSLEETMEAAREEQAAYLQALLNEYQVEVLKVVLDNVQRYARQEGFQLVLQDYTLGSPDEGFFSRNDYAQTLMSKPVVAAPGIASGANTHVTDITKILIHHMRNGGVPEKND